MPKIIMPGGGRLAWYDRSPLAIKQSYAQVLAPHGDTIQLAYSVPANRAFFLAGGFVYAYKQTLGSANSYVYAAISLDLASIGVNCLARIAIYDLAIGATEKMTLTGGSIVQSGSILYGLTKDVSVLGDTSFVLGFYGTEYDV